MPNFSQCHAVNTRLDRRDKEALSSIKDTLTRGNNEAQFRHSFSMNEQYEFWTCYERVIIEILKGS